MPASDPYSVITTTLVDTLGIPADLVRPDATFAELDLDSLALVELALIVEEQTGARLTDELGADSTLATAAEHLARLLSGTADSGTAGSDGTNSDGALQV
ncbi:acyl carrier protein [Streptomyces sp. NPDC003016]